MAAIVVLAQSAAGLAAGGYLASHGLEVRVLEVLGGAMRSIDPYLLEYGSISAGEHQCIGPAFRESKGPEWVLDSKGLRPAFMRKASGVSSVRSWLRRLADRPAGPLSWHSDYFHDTAQAVRIARTASGVGRGLPSIADFKQYFDVDRCWYAGDVDGWRRQTIANEMGEVLDDVDVLAIEVAKGRVASVETDVGREWLDSALFFDLPVHRVIASLPGALASSFASVLQRLRTVHRVQAMLSLDKTSLPNLVLVDDPTGVWRCRVVRGADGGPKRLVVDMAFSGGHDVREEARDRLTGFLDGIPAYAAAFGEPEMLVGEVDVGGPDYVSVLRALNRLNLYHVGQAQSWTAAHRGRQ